MLRFIQRTETDPYYNIAAEEYLLKTAATDTFMLWRNEPSVIVGKHQNTAREINHDFIHAFNLPVIRRISGGGTVYHDLGNINFSFIYTDRKENLIDFRYFTKPIILFLEGLGLNAAFQGKNNITVDGLKVSGNSAHIYRNKVLHHGTLLFSADLDKLDQAVSGREERYKDKSVMSVRSKVANIGTLLKEEIPIEEFIGLFRDFIFNYAAGAYKDELLKAETVAIHKLAEDHYKTSKWNFGYSPEYHFDDEWMNGDGNFSARLFVREGVIRQADLNGPEHNSEFLKSIAEILTGHPHEKKSISEQLKKLTFADETEEQILNQFIQHLF